MNKLSRNQIEQIMTRFYELVFDDVMIGYLFKKSDKKRLIEKEVELTLVMFGEKIAYTGKSMHDAHFNLKIRGGMFDRRMQILKKVLREFEIDSEVVNFWVNHSNKMRSLIVFN